MAAMGGTSDSFTANYSSPDYGTNLWLSISLSNNVVNLVLHNTQPGVPYLIRSREDLISGSWFSEGTVTGAIATTTTPAIMNIGERIQNLFIQTLVWPTSNSTAAIIPKLVIGGERIMELTTNGDVVSWGGNNYGELGDYTFLDSSNPVHVVGLTNITNLALGLNYSLAIDSNGTLWSWGQLDNSQDEANVPTQVLGMTNIIAIAAYGQEGGGDPAVAVKADGTVWMWGMSGCDTYGFPPVQIAGLSNIVSVAAGNCQTFALMTNGTVWMWGNGNEVPAPVSGLSNIVAICAGDYHTLALASNGIVWAWGYNGYGQLGDGGTEWSSDVPVRVSGVSNIVAVAAGANHSLALDGGGQLWAWGDDEFDQLGDGGVAYGVNLPMQVVGMTNIISIAAGTYASAAVDGNGNLWQWSQGIDWLYQEWGDENGHPRLSPIYVDFYNGQLPSLEILSGNNQLHHAGAECEQLLVFRVTDTNGVALSNAPVSVEVVAGDMELRTVSGGDNYKGLRLMTDVDGEVSLIGYVDEYVYNPDCLVRVLAASRERVVEVDFNEMIIPRPTISITDPADGGTYLVGTNQTQAITVDAEAAPGTSIQEVDYYYGTNGTADTLLGVSTQSPYSFIWTNSSWWANAFDGQYTISAVALDNAGGWSDAQSVTITVALDSEGNGMPDYWQLQYFDQLGIDPDADPDGDSISNLQEYQNGTCPTDYYNRNLPHLDILGGNDQAGNYDSFLPVPVSIKVSRSQYFTSSMANAPVTFTVTNGTALLAAITNDTPVTSLTLRTDINGQVSVWVYFPPSGSNPPDSTILVSASSGTDSITVIVNEFVPMGHWRFDNTDTWVGEAGQLPLLTNSLVGIPSWSSNAVLVDNVNPALLSYNVVETNGNTNINCQVGSVLFWFKPDWNSTNTEGNGPGTWGRLIEMGSYNSAFTNGWWSLYLSPDGTQLLFGSSTNGGGMTNLAANVSWYSNEWYQIALTYSPTGSALYVDGQLLANGAGVTYFPNADELTNGFRIGSDQDGNNQAGGAFDELETFNYPLDAANTCAHGSDIPDWWEVKYFNQIGLDPDFAPAGDGFTLLIDYQRGMDPNVINYSLHTAYQYVNSNTVPVQINIRNGVPSCMAVAVNTTNFVVVPYQLLDISSQFSATPWQPYNSNIAVPLNFGDGDYYVWVGLRGLSHDASITWQGIRLTLDTVPPILTITNPATSVVSKPVIQLQGCANEFLSSLTYDVSNASGVWTNQAGYVTGQLYDNNLTAFTTNWFQCYNVALTTNGVNLITLHAADLAGNTATTNFGFTLDASANTNPPALTVIWPRTGTYISGSNFTLQAQVNDPMLTVSASIVDASGNTNIVQGLVEQTGLVWVQNLPLTNGANTLTITAMDSAGNTSTTNLTLFQSSVLVTMNTLADDQFNQSSVSVSGTVSDSSHTVTVNGVTATVNPDGTWTADNVPASSSGTAIFDVEVYSGSAPSLFRANLRFTPMDAPSSGNDGSHVFGMTLPVKVGLMSYLRQTASSGLIAGGRYCAVVPCCGPAFGNYMDNINWDYQEGGTNQGYDFSTGYYNSGPGSPGWIMLSQPGYHAWSNPLPKGKDAYNAPTPWENISDAQDYVQTRVMIEPQGQIAAGSTVTYLVRAQAWEFVSEGILGPILGPQLPPDSMQIQGVTLTPVTDADGSVWGQTFVSALAGANLEVTPTAPGNYTFYVQAWQLGQLLAVDNNRDGRISLDGSDDTTSSKPFRFWINDSLESEAISDAANDIPGSDTAQVKVHVPFIRGPSDLVNFFPVALNLSNLLQLLPPSNGYEYHLSQADSAVDFIYANLSSTNAFDYLTNSTWWNTTQGKDMYGDFATAATESPGATLNTAFLNRILADGNQNVILVEGVKATMQPLMLEIWHNGQKLAGVPLYLSIDGIEKMYRHINLHDGPEAPADADLAGDLQVRNGDASLPTQMSEPINYPDSLYNQWFFNERWFIFVVGSNVGGQNARGWESEVFKRMYWSGNKAKFVGVSWFGDPHSGDFIFDYHAAVRNAFATAPMLTTNINALSGHKAIAGHSLGCGVIASAIADQGLVVDHACLFDAALAAECFDGDNAEDLPNMAHPAWVSSTDPSQSYYPRQLWASDWYKLFLGTEDARQTLTWKNRFAKAINKTDMHSFYSSTEDVLYIRA